MHVQDMKLPYIVLSAREMSIPDAIEKWRQPEGRFSDRNPPVNMLNITDNDPNVAPLAIAKEFTILRDACKYSNYSHIIGSSHRTAPHIGKQPSAIYSQAVDWTHCQQFRILAQPGSISGWHVDVGRGGYTWVSLEENTDGDVNKSIKYWKIFPLDSLSNTDMAQVRKDFCGGIEKGEKKFDDEKEVDDEKKFDERDFDNK
jgi:hypothetical protein